MIEPSLSVGQIVFGLGQHREVELPRQLGRAVAVNRIVAQHDVGRRQRRGEDLDATPLVTDRLQRNRILRHGVGQARPAVDRPAQQPDPECA